MSRKSGGNNMQPRRKSHTVILVSMFVVVAVSAGLWIALAGLFGRGSSSIERWAAAQIKMIASDLLVPTLSFDEFDFIFPGTLIFTNLRLTDQGVVCLEAASVRLTLREVPVRGQPIVIDEVELNKPVVRLVVGSDGALVGFDNFIKPSGGHRHADGGSSIPSDFLAIRKMTIADGAFRWTNSEHVAMELDDLDFDLKSQPDDDPGWYALEATLVRAPIMDLQMSGRFQLDQFTLELSNLAFALDLDQETKRHLPPALQTAIANYELAGELTGKGTATVPFTDLDNSELSMHLELVKAHLARGRLSIPVDQLTTDFQLSQRVLTTTSLQASVFGGHAQGQISIDFAQNALCEVAVSGADLRLERGLRETSDTDANFTGAATIKGSATASLELFPTDLSGAGTVAIENGRLWGDSLFRGLMEEAGQDDAGTDYGSLKFELEPDRAKFRKVRVVGGSTAAHGEGELHFDKRINFRFNTGPLERVEEALGVVGRALELVTDRVVTYYVTGTWAEPKFSVQPLGIGADPEDDQSPGK